MKKSIACLIMFSLAIAAFADKNWNTSVHSGWFNDPACWNGGVLPESGEWSLLATGSGEYTFTCPVGGDTTEMSLNLGGSGGATARKITIDATQGKWYCGKGAYINNWKAFDFSYTVTGGHIFNLEGVPNPSEAHPYYFSLDRGKLICTSSSYGSSLVLDGCDWNMYDPDGTRYASALYLAANGGNDVTFITTNGANFRASQMLFRGQDSARKTVKAFFYGGDHVFGGDSWGIRMNEYGYGTNIVRFIDSTVLTRGIMIGESNNTTMPEKNRVITNSLELCGTTRMTVTGWNLAHNSYVKSQLGLTATKNPRGGWSVFAVKDSAKLDLPVRNAADNPMLEIGGAKSISTNYNHSILIAQDDAEITYGGRIDFGVSERCDARLVLRDRAKMTSNSNYTQLYVGYGASATGVVSIADNALLTVGGDAQFGTQWGVGSVGILDISGNGEFRSTARVLIQCKDSAEGHVFLRNNAKFTSTELRVGYEYGLTYGNSMVLDGSGTKAAVSTLKVIGKRSYLDVTGGVFTVSGTECVIGNKATDENCRLALRGGELTATNALLEVAKTAGGSGSVELAGDAVLTAKQLKGGPGTASLLADGVTVIPSAASDAFITGFTTAELGTNGLELPVDVNPQTISQAFTDVTGRNGLFIKSGNGILTVNATSTHAKTQVDSGTLKLGSGVTGFGRELTVAADAVISLEGAATTLTADSLVIGDANGRGVIVLDAGDTVSVGSLSVVNGAIIFGSAVPDGEYTLFSATDEIPVEVLSKLKIINRASGKAYQFSLGADGKSVKLTIAEASPATITWTGAADSAWGTVGNWSGADRMPVEGDIAAFPDGATRTTVTIGDKASADTLQFTGTTGYTVSGGKLESVMAIEATAAGEHEIASALEPNADISATVAAGGKVTVSGDMNGSVGTFVKDGKGTFELAGDNTEYNAKIQLKGGRLVASGATALGADDVAADAITILPGDNANEGAVLEFNNDADVTINKRITSSTTGPFAFDVRGAGAVNVTQPFTATDGGFVKTGPGELTLNYTAGGNYYLAKSEGSCNSNHGPALDRAISFGADGNTPVWTDSYLSQPLGAFSLLDGTLRLNGNGSNFSNITDAKYALVRFDLYGLIGGKWNCEGNPTLILDSVAFRPYGSGRHFWIGGSVPAREVKPIVKLVAINHSFLHADTIRICYSTACHADIWFVMTNSYAYANYGFTIGTSGGTGATPDGKVHVIVSGSTGRIHANSNNTGSDAGFTIRSDADVTVTDGGTMEMNTSSGFLRYDWKSRGSVYFGPSSVFKGCGIASVVANGSPGVKMVFDGATWKYYASTALQNRISNPDNNTFTVEEGGLTIEPYNTPTLTHKLIGTGMLTKSGSNQLNLGPQLVFSTSSVTITNETPVVACGGFKVAQGKALCTTDNNIAETVPVEVAAGATLELGGFSQACGPLTGGGTVANGTFNGKIGIDRASADIPTFSNVTFAPIVNVDFGVTDDPATAIRQGTVIPVCRLENGTSLDGVTLRGRNCGNGFTAKFSVENGVVYARVGHDSFILYLR